MKSRFLIAKTNKDNKNQGLSLWVHLRDTMGIASKLAVDWVSESVIRAAKLNFEDFRKTIIFLAGVHDIGKATSYFQSVITQNCLEHRDVLKREGFEINDRYVNQGKTPHAWAGQWILQSEETQFRVPRTVAAVVGAHHGKPYENSTGIIYGWCSPRVRG